MPKKRGSPSTWTKEEFLNRVVKHESGCWFLPTNHSRAHRIAYRLFKGEIPKDLKKGDSLVHRFVCHTCDVEGCCNPDHLWLGTHSDNNQDRMAKDRSYRPVGDLNVMKRDELRKKRSGEGNPMFGKTHTKEARKRIADAQRGDLSPTRRPEVRKRLSESGRAVEDVTCEHCGKRLKPWTYARWHGGKCDERSKV